MKIFIRRSAIITILVMVLLTLTVSLASASGGNYHKVRYGETLFSIGRQYGVNPYLIARTNGLNNPDYIYAGQVLFIPSGGGQGGNCGWNNCGGNNWQSNCGWNDCGNSWKNVNHGNNCGGCGSNHYVVRRGDTLYSIGRAYGVSHWAIAKVNGIHNVNYIYAGQVLWIPSGGNSYW